MLKITSQGIPELTAWLKSLEQNVRQTATKAVAEYLVGDQTHGLKHYPPYKHVPWAAMGGFVSDRQRKYVMARIREGTITPGISASNGYLRDAWKYKAQGTRYDITNDTKYGKYLVGGRQTPRAIMQGWRTMWQTVKDNWNGALRHANAEVKKWLREHKSRKGLK